MKTTSRQASAAAQSLVCILAMATTLAASHALSAQSAPIVVPPPPMGWSSWNAFSNTVDSGVVMSQAKAMVANGMQKAGYRFVNIDEGWWLGTRDADGNIVVDPKAWPAIAEGEQAGDMGNIVRYIHGLGLSAGIYTDAGKDGCSTVGPDLGPSYPNTGSEGHYEQDFLQFAQWGFDYVKVDWCGGDKENLDPAVQYAEIARAIARAEAITGHRLYFSICNWGKHSPWTWGPNVGGVAADIWRTGGDIVAPIVANTKNAERKAEFKEVLREFDQAQHPDAQHSGFYNDPDMMVVGMPGLSEEENRAHMSLWAISGGPLLAGADLARLSAADLATLTNPDVIAIDQDPLGLPAVKAVESGPGHAATGLEAWYKVLSGSGERVLLLLNRSAAPAPISVRWTNIGLQDSSANVRDVWAKKDLGEMPSGYSATVPAGDVALFLVQGTEGAATLYFPDEAKAGAGSTPLLAKGHSLTFSGVSSRFPVGRVRITYTNPDKTPRFAELRVNGRIATRIAFPSTGGDATPGVLSIEATLDVPSLDVQKARNVLVFSTPCEPGPSIQSISVP